MVVCYTGLVVVVNAKKEQLTWNHILACAIQVGEMVSLFVLFSIFYKTKYTHKKTTAVSQVAEKVKDECQEAVTSGVKGLEQSRDAAVNAVTELSFSGTPKRRRSAFSLF